MSGGVKLTMYLNYYDPKNELVVSPIGISKSCAQLLSSKRKHEQRNVLPKAASISSVAVSNYKEADVRH